MGQVEDSVLVTVAAVVPSMLVVLPILAGMVAHQAEEAVVAPVGLGLVLLAVE